MATTDPFASIATPIQATPASQGAVASTDPFASIATPIASPAAPAPGFLQHAEDVGVGVVKGLSDTVEPISRAINKIPIIGETLAPASGVAAMPEWDKSTNAYQTAGKLLETGAEAAATEGMLSDVAVLKELNAADKLVGTARAARYVELADKYPTLAKAFNLASHHPWLARILTEGSKGAIVGGVEGGVKTRSVSGAAEGAAAGAAIGAATPILLNPFKSTQPAREYISNIWQGARTAPEEINAATSEAAQQGLREGVQSGAGVSTVQPQAVSTVLDHPIATLEDAASKNYKLMDNATGGKYQANVDALKNVNTELQKISGTNPARESELQAAQTRLEWQRDMLLNTAEANGVPKETVALAKQQFRQAQALIDLDNKVFKNFSVVDLDGNVRVDAALKALKRLNNNTTWGAPRAEQALGKDTADAMISSLEDARAEGQTAMNRYQMAQRFGKRLALASKVAGGGTTTIAAGTYLYNKLFGDN